MNTTNWLRNGARILDYCHMCDFSTIDLALYHARVKYFHANVVHFQCQDCMEGGLGETVFFHRTRLAKKQNRDLLGEYLPMAHADGVKVVVYTDCHWFRLGFAAEHPDWQVIQADGKPLVGLYGTNDTSFCINSPWHQWSFTVIEDLCRYEIDGIFSDGPVTFLGRNGCYCSHCRAKFQALHGREMPAANRDNREGWRLLVKFFVASLEDYYREAAQLVHRLRPGAVYYANAGPLGEPSSAAGRNNRGWLRHMDAILSEGGFYYGRVAGSQWKTGAETKLLETQGGGKPVINAVSTAQGPWRAYALTAPEVRRIVYQSCIGTTPYVAFFSPAFGQPGVEALSEVCGFVEQHAARFQNTRSGAEVALLCSTQTSDWYAGTDVPLADIAGMQAAKGTGIGNFTEAFFGYYEMLVRAGIPFDIVDEATLEANECQRYRLMILPNCACLSDTQCRLLEAYVSNGGGMIADFETSLYDEQGRQRNDFGLAGLFGVRSLNKVRGPHPNDFAFIRRASLPCLTGLRDELMPGTTYGLHVKLAGATTLGVYSKPLVSNLVRSVHPSEDPFVVENTMGTGRCIYFPSTFGQSFATCRADMFLDLFRRLACDLAEPPIRLDHAPHLLEVILRRQEQPARTIVHLLNYEMQPITGAVPAHDVKITVRCAHPVTRVVTLRAGAALAFVRTGEHVTATVPVVHEFEAMVLE
jgi:hypothetical protein